MFAMLENSGTNWGSSKYINEMTKQKTRSKHLFIHLVTTNALKQKEKKKKDVPETHKVSFCYFSSLTNVRNA